MPTDRTRLFLAAVAAALLLSGCADDTAADTTPAPSAPSAGADGGAGGGDPTRDRTGAPGASSGDSRASRGADPGSGSEPDNGGGGDPSGAVLEVPVAAEPSVESLGDLLGDSGADPARPLVAAPLPRAASARGRLVGGFPVVLRPVPGSRVESSSVSPADDRLQVALVGSTTQPPAQVLLGYRTRLGRRGLVEQGAAPTAAPGSQVAAMQRGRSVVTVTVTREGSRTSFSVIASLHTGRA